MIIDQKLLDELSAQAKDNPRLRQNYDLRNSADDNSQRMLNAMEPGGNTPMVQVEAGRWHSLDVLEPGTVVLEAKDGKYEPVGVEDVMELDD